MADASETSINLEVFKSRVAADIAIIPSFDDGSSLAYADLLGRYRYLQIRLRDSIYDRNNLIAYLDALLVYGDHLLNCEKWPECQCGYVLAALQRSAEQYPRSTCCAGK